MKTQNQTTKGTTPSDSPRSPAAQCSASIRVTAGDWGGDYNAPSGREAIKMFFRDIQAGKIKLCQLSPLGMWLRNDGQEIPFRIVPILMLAGKLTMEEAIATIKACGVDFTPKQITAMAQEDAWMLD